MTEAGNAGAGWPAAGLPAAGLPAAGLPAEQSADGWAVLDQARELRHQGVSFALATVVWRQSPSSGKQGCRAIITATGELSGWIGGACAEPVVVRAAREVIAEGTPRLLLLGGPEQFGGAVPEGISVVPIACQSEGALEVFIEPVVPVAHLVVVGRSPMASTLVEQARSLGWDAELVDSPEFNRSFTLSGAGPRSMIVVATQGHGDEEAVEAAVWAGAAYVGLVASARRGRALLGYLKERGVTAEGLDAVQVPAGLDLGPTSHREMAVGILANLVRLRASGALAGRAGGGGAEERGTGAAEGRPAEDRAAEDRPAEDRPAEAIDPVCGMTVGTARAGLSFEYQGSSYYFCCPGCRSAFERDPAAYLIKTD